jgi:hypothetical protein
VADFATVDDIAVRLGRTLTEAEANLSEQVIELTSGMIRDAAGQDADWDPTPVPALFTAICIDKVLIVASNPNLLTSEVKTLGDAERRRDFAHSDGLALTDEEIRKIKRLISGSTFVAATLTSPYSGDPADEFPELEL